MADWRPPGDHDAAERARAWLVSQHAQAHTQVLRLLAEAPTGAISQALTTSAPPSCGLCTATSPWPPDAGSTSGRRTPTGDSL
jgi:hypothetical protein